MSIKSKVLATAATLTLVGGVGTAGVLSAGPRSAATPSCGNSCIDIFSQQFGTHKSPNYMVDVLRQGEKIGQPIILFRTATATRRKTGPWRSRAPSPTSSRPAWSPPRSRCTTAASRTVLPGGNFPDCYGQTHVPGERPGVRDRVRAVRRGQGPVHGRGRTAVKEEGVTLQPCGVSSKTVWIADIFDSLETCSTGTSRLINGSDTNFSQPFVLTYPTTRLPDRQAASAARRHNITGFSNAIPPFFIPGPELGTVNVNQLWGADFGILK